MERLPLAPEELEAEESAALEAIQHEKAQHQAAVRVGMRMVCACRNALLSHWTALGVCISRASCCVRLHCVTSAWPAPNV